LVAFRLNTVSPEWNSVESDMVTPGSQLSSILARPCSI
jgi:hypothetical protein